MSFTNTGNHDIPVHDDSSINNNKSALTTRIISGSIGSVITSLVVTPLEVVKVRMQAAGSTNNITGGIHGTISKGFSNTNRAAVLVPCPRGCGTFVLFNGQMDCVLAKSSVPFFDKATGKLTQAATATAAIAAEEHATLGTFAMIRRIFAREGLAGIYAGLRPTLVMAAPNTVLYYTAYEEIVWRMRQQYGSSNTDYDDSTHYNNHNNNNNNARPDSFLSRNGVWLFPLLAGGSARLVSSTVTAPLEFLRTRQAAAVGQSVSLPQTATGGSGLWHDFRTIVQTEGAATLYRGLRPTLWRDVPFSAIYWLVLEQLRLCWKSRSRRVDVSLSQPPLLSPLLEQTGQAFINGAVAGMFAAACTTPFDLAKTRQQTAMLMQVTAETAAPSSARFAPEITCFAALTCKQDGAAVAYQGGRSNTKAATTTTTTGTFDQLRLIAQTDGVAGLWRGNQARMLKVAPACAIMLSSYELGKRILE